MANKINCIASMEGHGELKERVLHLRRIVWGACALIFVFAFALGGVIAFLTKTEDGAIVHGVSIGPFDVGGLMPDEALKLISAQTAAMEARGLIVRFGDMSAELSSSLDSVTTAELSVSIFKYAPEGAVGAAAAFGRQGAINDRLWQRIAARLIGKYIPLDIKIDEARVEEFLRARFGKFETPLQETSLTLVIGKSGVPEARITPGKSGMVFNYKQILRDIARHLSQFDYNPIMFRLETVTPRITPRQAQEATPSMLALAQGADIVLRYASSTLSMRPSQYAWWLGIASQSGGIVPVLYEDRVRAALKPLIASFEQPAQESRFRMEGGRVVEFQPPREGRMIDMADTIARLESALFKGGERTIAIKTIVQKPMIDEEHANKLGIKDILGFAVTRFTGSPKNRRANIAVGAAQLNGLLIAPGEEFSVVSALGKIDKSAGYLPELVIKEKKTVPEFGGGLCQVSTTVFRSVLSAGLPVTERSNHAYRVVYYEPAGKDATIYSPKPDLKFLNDTGNYILIQTKVSGDEIAIELWGTRDGRTSSASPARIYNIVSPPESKLIETADLPPGVKKCTERAHAGADAVFTYAIAYVDGRVNKQSFFSRYKPWGEVCLIGVSKQETKQEPSADEAQGF